MGSEPMDPGSNPGRAIFFPRNIFISFNLFFFMAVGVVLFIIVILVIAIWIIIEAKRMRHKIFAIFLIALILFSYISASIIFKGQDIDLKTIPGVITGSRIYFSWLGSVFVNLKQITTKAIEMNWGTNETAEDIEKEPLLDFGKNK